ncbi:hypothetical protein REPUB_Repub07fG0081100 [Reevesia pubescens]
MSKYAKFLKELCIKKKKHKSDEVMYVGENNYALIQRKLPPKLKDSGSFVILCSIGKTKHCKDMLDLGVSVNVMPYSIYAALNIGNLKEFDIVI